MSITDVDYWIHKYKVMHDRVGDRTIQHLMMVELKTMSREVPFSQRDTLGMAWRILASNIGKNKKLRIDGKVINVRFWGIHVLRLSGTAPDNSNQIWWNKQLVSTSQLEEILNFTRSPLTLRVREDRRHHVDRNAQLF